MTNSSAAYDYMPASNVRTSGTAQRAAYPSTAVPAAAGAKKSAGTNTAYTIILVSAIIAVAALSVLMLKAQFTVADASERIIAQTQELNALKQANDKLEAGINETVDLKEIRRIAVEEYGMVLRNDMNTLAIARTDMSYTDQMAPIVLQEKEEISLGHVLGLISKDW